MTPHDQQSSSDASSDQPVQPSSSEPGKGSPSAPARSPDPSSSGSGEKVKMTVGPSQGSAKDPSDSPSSSPSGPAAKKPAGMDLSQLAAALQAAVARQGVVDADQISLVSSRFWSLRKIVALGVLIISIGLGGGMVWAVTAPLAEGVVASGEVVVDTNRKTVQHLEGGIIEEIFVRESDKVQKGTLLIKLDSTQSLAALRAAEGRYFALLGQLSRLTSEFDERTEIVFDPEMLERADEVEISGIMQKQTYLFNSRRRALAGQRLILRQRLEQYEQKVLGLDGLRDSLIRRLDLLAEELEGEERLLERGNTTKTRVLDLRRDSSEVEGLLAETAANIAETEVTMGETQLQILQLDNNSMSEVSDEITRVTAALSEQSEQVRAREDILSRTNIIAPQSGVVVNLRFFTVGGVVPPGSAVLDIVPKDDRLVVRGQLRPTDVDSVQVGMSVRVRLVAFQQLDVPELQGVLELRSADILQDNNQAAGGFTLSYYEIRAGVSEQEIARLPEGINLVPGMPVEILVQAGERTVWDYITAPIVNMLARAGKEK